MPHKTQIFILFLSRLVDFWQMSSLQSYMVYQLRAFDSALSEATISHQAGILQGSFTAAQIITSVLWGRAADSPTMGRKSVLLIGLVGTAISCVGVGFSATFGQAVLWRLLGGAVNGTVGAARTMVAETVPKQWHSRAFLLLPVAFNVASILGPLVGGLLVEPAKTYPATFGEVEWMQNHPYVLPSLLSAALLIGEACLVMRFLVETLPTMGEVRGIELYFEDMVYGIKSILSSNGGYAPPSDKETEDQQLLRPPKRSVSGMQNEFSLDTKSPQQLPFKQIWTPNVLWTLLSVAMFDFHMGAFNSLWIIFLTTARSTESRIMSITHFTGGLSFSPGPLSLSLSILGILGLLLQIVLYPWANSKYGLMRCFRLSLFLFPLAYFLAPYLALIPSTSPTPAAAAGCWIWLGISAVLTLQVTARTFALPASIILVNNASPHPSVLGTIHGVGQATSSAFRTIGPVASGYWYGLGLKRDMVGLSWWLVAAFSAVGCVTSFWVRNGDGHEIMLPGEDASDLG
ncbi:MFS general substrate transporter [Lophiostoma macrostomum CBS 122681]|uniref:MFS general substrate transporter n=1 Tax=Lophiostoma macrostomum CBS 122681 TaxID=1314788 RepID=A0A6A6TGS4_9PLEO|nr:MFS general substrate transporter [Lophiostoma macrostomum CBS 122681]